MRSKRSKKWHARKAAREAQLTADKALAPEDYNPWQSLKVHQQFLAQVLQHGKSSYIGTPRRNDSLWNQMVDNASHQLDAFVYNTSDKST